MVRPIAFRQADYCTWPFQPQSRSRPVGQIWGDQSPTTTLPSNVHPRFFFRRCNSVPCAESLDCFSWVDFSTSYLHLILLSFEYTVRIEISTGNVVEQHWGCGWLEKVGLHNSISKFNMQRNSIFFQAIDSSKKNDYTVWIQIAIWYVSEHFLKLQMAWKGWITQLGFKYQFES